MWSNLCDVSAVRDCDEVCCITIHNKHNEAKFLFGGPTSITLQGHLIKSLCYMVISKRWILISTTIQSIPLVKLIAIPSISNPALVSTVLSWTTNIIQSKYIDRNCIHNTHNDLQHAHNYIIYQNYQFHSLLLMPSKTNVVVFILRLLIRI